MEMANYIDSMFGVYCSPPSASNNGDDGVGAAASSCDTQVRHKVRLSLSLSTVLISLCSRCPA